jgi:hypothetical protein
VLRGVQDTRVPMWSAIIKLLGDWNSGKLMAFTFD